MMKYELISDDENDEQDEDDMITLSGCGKITKWKFPEDIEHCPVESCQELFDSRHDAIAHYKQQHAIKSILCYLCEAPITTFNFNDFENHFKKWHPNDMMPFEFHQNVKQENISLNDEGNKENTRTNDQITLTCCHETTYWNFPQTEWSHCVAVNCQEIFDTRSEAMSHFIAKHANSSIYCKLCDKPIITHSYDGFNEHFRRVHPNADIPYSAIESEKPMLQILKIQSVQPNGNGILGGNQNGIEIGRENENGTQNGIENGNDSLSQNNDDEDDLITIGQGLGFITQFKFPKNNHCPIYYCEVFDSRSEAIAHYKQQHAKYSIFCEQCNRPLSVHCLEYYRTHYRKQHPFKPIPLDIHGKSAIINKEDTSSESCIDKNQDEVDDVIILKACGIATKWTFPLNTTKCPAQRCNRNFEYRAHAIAHYRRNHNSPAILCDICNKPVVTGTNPGAFIQHFERIHPFKRIPYNLDGKADGAAGSSQEENTFSDDEQTDDLITLTGCGFTTEWRFPPNVTRCPSIACTVTFSTRSAGIAHYKEKHANAVLCPICKNPVSTRAHNVLSFIKHYQDKHPGEPIPYDFDKKCYQEKKSELSTENETSDKDDLITLRGGGVNTEWRFPETSQCPSCNKNFGIRALAINHFKHRHAKWSAFCPECDKPVSVKTRSLYYLHYSKLHPNAELPKCLEKYKPESYESDDESEVDDLIILSGGGQITEYRFPKTKKCPVLTCSSVFEKRSQAIQHYKKVHAKKYIFCTICEKPISGNPIHNFMRHYEEVHPNEEPPLNVNEADENEDEDLITLRGGGIFTFYRFPQSTLCPSKCCNREFDNRSDAITHYKIWHAPYFMFCSECDNLVGTTKLTNYKEHFQQMHPQMEIPPVKIIEPLSESDENNTEEESNDDEDDEITLKGLGVTTTWTFPDVKICPNKHCSQEFQSRSKAIRHFKQQHSNYMVLCPLCNVPFSGRSKDSFIQHYQRMHPYKPLPYNLKNEDSNLNENVDEMKDVLENGDNDDTEVNDVITLEGFGQKTEWRFPKTDWSRCPVLTCKTMFKCRSHAILHYKKLHAKNYCLCKVCEKPINGPKFVEHYVEKHPGIDFSTNFDNSEANLIGQEQVKDDDIITLKGKGQNYQWRFPDELTSCPIKKCFKKFPIRKLAINHFKQTHAETAIFCSECDKPICVKHLASLASHYAHLHPEVEKPSFLNETNDDACEDEDGLDDLIALGGGDSITYWRFPKTKRCPSPNCSALFRNRADAIIHYKLYHAPKNTLCCICKNSISAVDASFIHHYQKHHPDAEIPKNDYTDNDLIILKGGGEIKTWRFPNISQCPVRTCTKKHENRSEVIIHYKKTHTMNYQYCDICEGPVPTYKYKQFRDHMKKDHGQEKDDNSNKSDSDEDDWIVLSGGGQITQWQFPKNRKACPVQSCTKSFGVRSDTIDHYRKMHSMNYILCSVCDKPVLTKHILDFNRHYIMNHPNHQLPCDFVDSNNDSNVESSHVTDSSSLLNNSNKENDVNSIELYGTGHVTHFRYPKITQCLAYKCGENFQTQLEAIAHFKEKHAFTHTYCSLCQAPVRVHSTHGFKLHYIKFHKDHPFPSFSDDIGISMKPKEKVKPTLRSSMVKKTEEIDDTIQLECCGFFTEWKFPDELTNCFMMKCDMNFDSRSDAIMHFRNQHSKNAMYCSICDMPISAMRVDDFKEHYLSFHPDIDVDLNFDLEVKSCTENLTSWKVNEGASCSKRRRSLDTNETVPINNEFEEDNDPDVIKLSGCGRITYWRFPKSLAHCPNLRCKDVKFDSRSDAIQHYRIKHAANAILCRPCNKPIVAPGPHVFISHNQRMHPMEKNPLGLHKNDAKYLIKLNGCDRTTYWHFPNTKRCPVVTCKMTFENREAAAKHYERKHAPNAYLCPICNKPVGSCNAKVLLLHYRKRHPGKKAPVSLKRSKTDSKIEIERIEEKSTTQKIEENVDEGDDVITLKALGYVTKWKVPADMTTCPVQICKKTFDDRSALIDHYKATHANGSIYCSICDKPLRMGHNKKDIERHFRRKHQITKIPFAFRAKKCVKKEVQISTETKDEETNNQVDDIIILEGLGRTMEWRFPETNQCPSVKCRLTFRNRSEAIIHYRKNHTKNKLLCPICKKPVAVHKNDISNLRKHIKALHPHVKYNPKIVTKNKISIQKKKQTEILNDEDEDVITFEGLGKMIKWRFPETNLCPSPKCTKPFKDRATAIAHFKETHSQTYTLCPECKKPISVSNPTNLDIHMQSKHRSKTTSNISKPIRSVKANKMPMQKAHFCKLCNKSVRNYQRHMFEMHTLKKIFCPLKDCSFKTKRTELLRKHWSRCHANFKFPEIRRESGFSYKMNESSDDEQDEQEPKRMKQERSPNTSYPGKNKRARRSCRSSSSSSSSDDEISSNEAKKRKIVNHPSGTEGEESPKIKKLKAMMSDCSVVLDDSLIVKMSPSKSNLSHPMNETHDESSQSQVFGTESPRVMDEQYNDALDNKNFIFEPEVQMQIGSFIPMSEPGTSQFQNATHFPQIIDVHNGIEVKQEKVIEQPKSLSQSEVFYVPDSDEEEEQQQQATNSTNSSNTSSIQADESTHVRQMGVLMMVKKEFK